MKKEGYVPPPRVGHQDAVLGFGISVRVVRGTGNREDGEEQRESEVEVEVVVRWLKGDDRMMFESFCGALKRWVDEAEGEKRRKCTE